MIINVSDLKKFANAAVSIPTGSVIPVHAFVLLSHGVMLKTNDRQYVSYTAEFDGECLIDEKVLFDYIAHTKAETIEIKVSAKSVKITDGKRAVTAPTADVKDFQQPLKPDGAPFPVPSDVLQAIGTCSKFIMSEDELAPMRKHVFVGNKTVIGSDGHIAFRQEFMDDLPEICLSRSEAILMGSMKSCLFTETGAWHFFQSEGITYGCIKSESKYVDLRGIFPTNQQDFEIDRAELLGFLTHANSSAVSKSVVGQFSASSGFFNLEVRDKSYDIDISQAIPYEGPDVGGFGFGPSLFLRLVKAFTADRYGFSSATNMYSIKAGNVTTLIMEMK